MLIILNFNALLLIMTLNSKYNHHGQSTSGPWKKGESFYINDIFLYLLNKGPFLHNALDSLSYVTSPTTHIWALKLTGFEFQC